MLGLQECPGCVYPREPEKPILECEEFEGFPSAPSSYPTKKAQAGTGAKGRALEKGRFKGLCKDCENRKACTFPKSEGGVWHCEEYR